MDDPIYSALWEVRPCSSCSEEQRQGTSTRQHNGVKSHGLCRFRGMGYRRQRDKDRYMSSEGNIWGIRSLGKNPSSATL